MLRSLQHLIRGVDTATSALAVAASPRSDGDTPTFLTAQIDTLQESVAELDAQLDADEENMFSLQESLNVQIIVIRGALAEAEKTIAQKIAQLTILEAEIGSLQGMVAKRDAQLDAEKEKRLVLEEEHNEQIIVIGGELAEAQITIAQNVAQLTSLEAQIDSLNDTSAQLNAQLDAEKENGFLLEESLNLQAIMLQGALAEIQTNAAQNIAQLEGKFC